MMDWVPIESAPKDGRRILTWGCLHDDGEADMGEKPSVQMTFWHGGHWCSCEWGSHEPTKWQPLPAPPTNP